MESLPVNLRYLSFLLLIYAAVTAAWMFLGGTIDYRTRALEDKLSQEVTSLWGPSGLVQRSPYVFGKHDREPLASKVQVRLDHHDRYKGLLWFSTYAVDFVGDFEVQAAVKGSSFCFELPAGARFFEGLVVTMDGKPIEPSYRSDRANTLNVPLPDQQTHRFNVRYRTRGRDRWSYDPTLPEGQRVPVLRRMALSVTTNFDAIDYPSGTISPVSPATALPGGGRRAVWQFDNVRMGESIGIQLPSRVNAGPLAARMSYFAPISLLFFFTVLFTIVLMQDVPLHPMHYLFAAAGFFSFNILMSYLVDIINIHLAFWICAGVSVFLVVSYMRIVAGARVGVGVVGLAQLVYLVGFSYAFFWHGRTGLVITCGAIATLFVLMQATARVDWSAAFDRPRTRLRTQPDPAIP